MQNANSNDTIAQTVGRRKLQMPRVKLSFETSSDTFEFVHRTCFDQLSTTAPALQYLSGSSLYLNLRMAATCTNRLESLPLELLEEIFKQLPVLDILTVGQVWTVIQPSTCAPFR